MTGPGDLSTQRWHNLVSGSLLENSSRRGYNLGENVTARVHGLDGRSLGRIQFQIQQSAGSGFAGQVYQAALQSGSFNEAWQLSAGQIVAIKVLRPCSVWKTSFRDFLFHICFQTGFAPRLRAAALRSGLMWQELIRRAARSEFGSSGCVAQPYGYYWDAGLASYVEIHEWVNGRGMKYEVDDRLFMPAAGRAPPDTTEIARKHEFMRRMVGLCCQVGATGISRQYEWYTFVSQANVLTRLNPKEGETEFVCVDFRPGLAVPFFLPLSPTHLRLIVRGLLHGVFVHFDEVDLDRLEAYRAEHPQFAEETQTLVARLEGDEHIYRTRLPDFWQRAVRSLRRSEHSHSGWREIRLSSRQDWLRMGWIDLPMAQYLRNNPGLEALFLILENLPFLGPPLLRWFGHGAYREHVIKFITASAYRSQVIGFLQARDLLDWEQQARISTQHANSLSRSLRRYTLEKLCLGWMPDGWHRWITDGTRRKLWLHDWLLAPLRVWFDRRFRQDWLLGVLNEQYRVGRLNAGQFELLNLQAGEDRLQGFIRDLGLTLGLELFAKCFYLSLAVYGASTRNFLPLAIAMFGPVAPSGVIRGLYVLAQLVVELPGIIRRRDRRLLLARWIGLLVAPWRMAGNLFALVEMFAYYPKMSLALADYFVRQMLKWIPVLGGPGKLLEYWAFQLTYNLPLSIRRVIS